MIVDEDLKKTIKDTVLKDIVGTFKSAYESYNQDVNVSD